MQKKDGFHLTMIFFSLHNVDDVLAVDSTVSVNESTHYDTSMLAASSTAHIGNNSSGNNKDFRNKA